MLDNGAELTAEAVRNWLWWTGMKTLFIEPGSPWGNENCETFKSKLRDELLISEVFYLLKEARILIKDLPRHFNMVRSQSSIRYRPPTQEADLPGPITLLHAAVRLATPGPSYQPGL